MKLKSVLRPGPFIAIIATAGVFGGIGALAVSFLRWEPPPVTTAPNLVAPAASAASPAAPAAAPTVAAAEVVAAPVAQTPVVARPSTVTAKAKAAAAASARGRYESSRSLGQLYTELS